MIIILVVVLLLFGGRQLPHLAKGMGESIRNFKVGMSREQRQQSGDSRLFWFLVLALIAVAIIFSVLSLDVFSDKQKFVLAVVLLGWIGVGYWSFGRK